MLLKALKHPIVLGTPPLKLLEAKFAVSRFTRLPIPEGIGPNSELTCSCKMVRPRKFSIVDGIVPTKFNPCIFNLRIEVPEQTTRYHEHTSVEGIPATQFHPDVKLLLDVNAAAKSHMNTASLEVGELVGSTDGTLDGWPDGITVGIPDGTPLGDLLGCADGCTEG